MKLRSTLKDPEDLTTSEVVPCFFCLQNSRALGSDIPNQTERFSLRHISRFLKIFENDDEQEKLSEDLKRKLHKFVNDSTVFICPDCSKMTKEFDELYHLMEVTKLQMNWCIQRMSDVVAMAKSKEKSRSSESGTQLVEMLRSKMSDKIKMVTSHPRVILRQAKLPRPNISHAEIREKTPAVTSRSKSNRKASKKSCLHKLNISNGNLAKRLIIGSNGSKLNVERRQRILKNANVQNHFPSA